MLTPLILLFTLPNCAGDIVDFFREFTVEVEGLGRVCSFAVSPLLLLEILTGTETDGYCDRELPGI